MNCLFDSFPNLETERLVLRQETVEDALAVLQVLSDPAVTKFHDLDTFTKIEEAIALIQRRRERFESGRGIRWGIALKQDNNLIGSCGLMWNQQLHSAEVGYELASAFWRQGMMTEALKSILKFSFQEVNLQFVVAEVMLGNIASKKLLEKLGFQNQGVLQQQGFWKGKYHDLEQFILRNPGKFS